MPLNSSANSIFCLFCYLLGAHTPGTNIEDRPTPGVILEGKNVNTAEKLTVGDTARAGTFATVLSSVCGAAFGVDAVDNLRVDIAFDKVVGVAIDRVGISLIIPQRHTPLLQENV